MIVFDAFCGAAFAEPVVDGTTDGLAAEVFPVGLGVEEVLVPDTIYVGGWGEGRGGDRSQEHKFFVFLNDL